MPLYAAILDDKDMPINAIAYGQVRYQDCTFRGITEQPKSLPGVSSTFVKNSYETDAKTIADQIPIWRYQLNQLITNYSNGLASVAPKDESTCQFCDLKGLCRISEMSERPALDDNSHAEVEVVQ